MRVIMTYLKANRANGATHKVGPVKTHLPVMHNQMIIMHFYGRYGLHIASDHVVRSFAY